VNYFNLGAIGLFSSNDAMLPEPLGLKNCWIETTQQND
jgi:hypothetical protein